MDRDEALKLLSGGGVIEWNRRRAGGEEIPSLEGANLSRADLRDANLSRADLRDANCRDADLSTAYLRDANLSYANLSHANLKGANLSGAHIRGADLSSANLQHAGFVNADLSNANLCGASLQFANIIYADLTSANLRDTKLSWTNIGESRVVHCDFGGARMKRTKLAGFDLSAAKGLADVVHIGGSSLGIDTLYRSKGKIPTAFLEGCGVPDSLITYLPSLLEKPFEFYSCFISYSTTDQEFCERLHARMRQEHLRVWYAPEDMKAGRKIDEQIDHAIRVNDKLLLILSNESMASEWVKREIRHARQREVREGKRVLFPIRLVSFEAIQDWSLTDSKTGADLAEEIRQYFIPDFSNWKDHDTFEAAFARLLSDLGKDDEPAE